MSAINKLSKWIIFTILFFTASNFTAQGWETSFGQVGNSGSTFETGYTILELSDGGFLVGADSNHVTFGRIAYIFRTDAAGNQLWNKPVFFGFQDFSRFTDVIQNNNGNYTFFGHVNMNSFSQSDLLLLTIDENGNTISSNTYGTNIDEQAIEFVQHSNGDYYLFGRSFLGNAAETIMVRVDQNGNEIWQKKWDWGDAEALTETSDGNLLMLSSFPNPATVSWDIVLQKVNTDGDDIWDQTHGGNFVEQARDIIATPDDGFIILGIKQLNGQDPHIIKVDASGNELWTTTFENFDRPVVITPTSDGNYVIGGQLNGNAANAILQKIDPLGNEIWRRSYGGGYGEGPGNVIDVIETQDNKFALTGSHGRFDILLAKTDEEGFIYTNLVSGSIFANLDGICQMDPNSFPWGSYWKVEFLGNPSFTTYCNSLGNFETTIDTGTYEVKIAELEGGFWTPCTPLPQIDLPNYFDNNDLGNIFIIPNNPITDTICGRIYIDTDLDCEYDSTEVGIAGYPIIFDAFGIGSIDTIFTNGNGEFIYPYFANTGYGIWPVFPNGDCNLCPWPNTFVSPGGKVDINLGMQCDSLIAVISGNVLHDIDDDCFWTAGDEGLSFWQVKAVKIGTTDTIINYTNSDGYYFMANDTGTYALTVLPPSQLWQPCLPTLFTNAQFNNPQVVDFLVQSNGDCPDMSIDLGTGVLRACDKNLYTAHYCNNGSADADSVFLEIELDTFMTFLESTIPISSQNGQTLTFDVGAVEAGECGQFTFLVFLSCDALVGQTHCIDAHIFPDTLCDDFNMLWDMSNIEVTASCVGDSVIFEILNIGTGNMMNMNEFIVIEDNVLIRSGEYELQAGMDTSFVFYPNGTTLRMETDQTLAHPFPGIEAAWVEGCNAMNPANFSLGFITQYPTYASAPYMVTDCRESVDSFDPNDKQGFPKGVTDEHFIRPNMDLEYLIRFQNTGTDTAFQVILIDTISTFLNPESLRPGASSHAYEFELLNGNVAQFTFNDIMLPDSATNETESIGFIKFRIAQIMDNPPNTLIENEVAIYFDNNAPILTNQTEHRIPAPELIAENDVEICEDETYNGQIYTQDTTFVETIPFAFFDSLYVTNLGIQPNYEINIDTIIMEGSIYKGIEIWNDTTLMENLFTEYGCDSLVISNIEVAPVNVFDQNDYPFSIELFPNPSSHFVFLKFEIQSSEIVQVNLLNPLGQKVETLITQEDFSAGIHSLKFNLSHFPKGIYLLDFQIGADQVLKKMVIE